jgi:hypothetical protein
VFSGKVASLFDDDSAVVATTEYTGIIDWGDGKTSVAAFAISDSPYSHNLFNVTGSHVYNSTGAFSVVVTVKRLTTGNVATVTSPAYISPELHLFPATIGFPDAPISEVFSGKVASLFDDDSAEVASTEYTGIIDWGDGTTSVAAFETSDSPYSHNLFNVKGSHTYNSTGAFSVVVTVKRPTTGNVATVTSPAYIGPELHLFPATIGFPDAPISEVFSGNVASLSDDDPAVVAPTEYTGIIDWGDGKTSVATFEISDSPYSHNLFNVKGSHVYNSTGAFSVVVTVKRPTKGNVATVTSPAYISQELRLFPETIGYPDAPISEVFSGKVASLSDEDPAVVASTEYTGIIDWGDGTTSVAAFETSDSPYSHNLFNVTGSHTYNSAGAFSVVVTATRSATGNSTTVTSPANVAAQ